MAELEHVGQRVHEPFSWLGWLVDEVLDEGPQNLSLGCFQDEEQVRSIVDVVVQTDRVLDVESVQQLAAL